MIPLRTAYRLCASVLFDEANRLDQMRPADAERRRGPGAARAMLEREPGRRARAHSLRQDAAALMRAERADDSLKNRTVDAAVLGYLLSWLTGWAEGLRLAQEELADMDRTVSLPDHRDRLAVCKIVLHAAQE